MRKAGLCALLTALLAAASAAPALAQHGTTGYAVMPMDPNTSALLEVQLAEFALPGRSGLWQTFAARAEYAPVPQFSLALRPMFASIDYDDGASEAGLADTEVVAKARLWKKGAGWPASVSLGLSAELPTGDADEGTGNGHVSLFPFATFSSVPAPGFMLHVMVGDRFVVAGEEHAAAGHVHPGAAAVHHGSVIMPHGEHELVAHGGACFMFDRFAISPGLEWMQVLSNDAETQLNAQLELAVVPVRQLRVAAGFDLPLVAQPRYEWRARMMSAWLF